MKPDRFRLELGPPSPQIEIDPKGVHDEAPSFCCRCRDHARGLWQSGEQAKELQTKAEAVIDEQALGEAAGAVIDEKAVEGVIKGAVTGTVQDALREVVPAQELGMIGAVVDEEALVRGLDKAVDREALRGLAQEAGGVRGSDAAPAH